MAYGMLAVRNLFACPACSILFSRRLLMAVPTSRSIRSRNCNGVSALVSTGSRNKGGISLGADVRLIPCKATMTARDLAVVFFDHWFCENGLPLDIVSDRGSLFLSQFWKHLHELTGISLKLSSSFHPETDGLSERTNKTLNQALRAAVSRHHHGWVAALPRIRFHIMNTCNASTGFSGFQLRLGVSPRLMPPLLRDPVDESEETPLQFFERIQRDVGSAADNLLETKVNQASQANKFRVADVLYVIGDKVLLSTKNLSTDHNNEPLPPTKKLRPKFIGPFTITAVDLRHSTVTLNLPGPSNRCRVFHTSLVKPYKVFVPDTDHEDTNAEDEHLSTPPSKPTDNGVEHFIRDIIQHRKSGRGYRFLVRWQGFPESHNEWKTYTELNHTKALDDYLKLHGPLE